MARQVAYLNIKQRKGLNAYRNGLAAQKHVLAPTDEGALMNWLREKPLYRGVSFYFFSHFVWMGCPDPRPRRAPPRRAPSADRIAAGRFPA